MRTGYGIIIQEPAFAFLHKAFGYRINRRKEDYDPEQNIPDHFISLAFVKARRKVKRNITNKYS